MLGLIGSRIRIGTVFEVVNWLNEEGLWNPEISLDTFIRLPMSYHGVHSISQQGYELAVNFARMPVCLLRRAVGTRGVRKTGVPYLFLKPTGAR